MLINYWEPDLLINYFITDYIVRFYVLYYETIYANENIYEYLIHLMVPQVVTATISTFNDGDENTII